MHSNASFDENSVTVELERFLTFKNFSLTFNIFLRTSHNSVLCGE